MNVLFTSKWLSADINRKVRKVPDLFRWIQVQDTAVRYTMDQVL